MTTNQDSIKFHVSAVTKFIRLATGFTPSFVHRFKEDAGDIIVVLAGANEPGKIRAEQLVLLFPFWTAEIHECPNPNPLNPTNWFVRLSLPRLEAQAQFQEDDERDGFTALDNLGR
ncbi:MAG: hypothetical protein HOO67_05490 [Candidatus Peribacteraceae bacterium]|nr:hypothetical protein [Candidatus Peribacteraceae bacterium]